MGVYYSEKEKIVFGVLVAPDGRVICQKSEHKDFISPWRATLYKKMDCAGVANVDRASEHCIRLELERLFHVSPEKIRANHLFSHFMDSVGKRLEVVLCEMGASATIRLPNFVKVRPLALEDLSRAIEEKEAVFCNFTKEAMNVFAQQGGRKCWK